MTSYHAVAIIEVMVRDNNRKQEIAEKALELFSIYGYEATSLSMIAEAVGIRKASLFNHYSGKQAILDEIKTAGYEGYTVNGKDLDVF